MTDLYKKIGETMHPTTTDEVLALRIALSHALMERNAVMDRFNASVKTIDRYKQGVLAARHQRRQARRKMTKIARQRDEARAALKASRTVRSICLDSSNSIYISGGFTSSSPFVELSEEDARQAAAYKLGRDCIAAYSDAFAKAKFEALKAAHAHLVRREELRSKIVEVFATTLVLTVTFMVGLCVLTGLGFVLVELFRAVAWAWEGLVRGV